MLKRLRLLAGLRKLRSVRSWSLPRSKACSSLGHLHDRRAVPALIEALEDRDERVRGAAADALGELGDPRALFPLIRRLVDKEPIVRRSAAAALGRLGDRHPVTSLIAALGDQDGTVRLEADRALSALGEPGWTEAVRGDGDDLRRLGNCADPRAVEALAFAIGVGHPGSDHFEAIEALGRIGGPGTAMALASAMTHKDFSIRRQGAQTLAALLRRKQGVLGLHMWQTAALHARAPHEDGSEYFIDSCNHDIRHRDSGGIGVDFPSPPAPGTNF